MKVAIVGGAPRSRNLAPYDDEEWEIWALGVHLDHPRISKIFEIHPEFSYESEDYPQRLVDLNIPIVVREGFPIKADHVEIFDRSQVKIGHLTSSIAYMMAYAVMNGATHIHIYGVDMDIDDNEYFYQRPGVYAWKGYAEALGIEVKAIESSLFKDNDYPYNINRTGPFTENEFRKMAAQHQEKINEYTTKINELQRLIDIHSGSKQTFERLAKIGRAIDAGIEVLQIDHSTVIRR